MKRIVAKLKLDRLVKQNPIIMPEGYECSLIGNEWVLWYKDEIVAKKRKTRAFPIRWVAIMIKKHAWEKKKLSRRIAVILKTRLNSF